jgi:hypothetical protein
MPAPHPETIAAVTREGPVENRSPPVRSSNVFRNLELSDRTPSSAFHGKEKFYSLPSPEQTQTKLNQALRVINEEGFWITQLKFHQRENGRCFVE